MQKFTGICKNQLVNSLEPDQIENITQTISLLKIEIDKELKKKIYKNYEKSVNIKSYKGLRKKKGYPARGQRTHSNGKTAKKKRIL